jgi:hypothetical protein
MLSARRTAMCFPPGGSPESMFVQYSLYTPGHWASTANLEYISPKFAPPDGGHPPSTVAAPGIRLLALENADAQSHPRIPAADVYSCGFVNAGPGADREPRPKDRAGPGRTDGRLPATDNCRFTTEPQRSQRELSTCHCERSIVIPAKAGSGNLKAAGRD